MRTARRAYVGVAGHTIAATAALWLATGCGVTVGGETSTAGQTTTDEEQVVEWNPCSELSEEALRATGADPAGKSTNFDAPGDRATWRMCSWDSVDDPYVIGVGATAFTQEDLRENTSVTGIRPVQINGRSGSTFYQNSGEDPIRLCYVSLPMQKGMLTVYVNWRYSQRDSLPESPPCGLAVQHAQILEPYLPE
ncbi:DUF3558 domain-containing protein [Nocardia sp. X0981]